jgi:hypothetical protein
MNNPDRCLIDDLTEQASPILDERSVRLLRASTPAR